MSAIDSVEEVGSIPAAAFIERFVERSRPVVLRGIASGWTAVRHWTFPALRAGFGNQRMRVRGSDQALDVFFGSADEREMSFADYLDAILADATVKRRPYLGNFLLNHPEMDPVVLRLLDDLAFPDFFATLPERQLRIWVAGAGQQSTIHNDNYENLNAQIIGRKSFRLFAPGEHDKLYAERVNEGLWSSPIEIGAPQLDRYPRFAEARALHCTLAPGDMLYIPRFWWHQATADTASININAWHYLGAGRDETWEARRTAFATEESISKPGDSR
ncbi:MAG TPA: cupin-like domain-containing protein [Allosphingosinicella sp.]|jgi:lysine-specific demethylase 8